MAIPLGAVAILASLKPEIVRGTLSSTESVLRFAALVAVCLVLSRLLWRFVGNAVVRAVLTAVPATLLVWLNVAPYFQDDIKIRGSFPESYTTAGNAPASPAPSTAAPEAVDVTAPPPAPEAVDVTRPTTAASAAGTSGAAHSRSFPRPRRSSWIG